jgi:type IV pilus assembly protein PilE
MSFRGVTLLEILVVLLLVAVIAAIAVPGYRHHVRRVNRTDATVALYALLSAQERFHLRHGSYTSDLTSTPPAGLGLEMLSQGRHYSLSVDLAADRQSFIATATPVPDGPQAGDEPCLAFSIDHRGRRAVTGSSDAATCWR